MPIKISRRDFIKLAGLGAAASATGILIQKSIRLSSERTIKPITIPELRAQNGIFATTCSGCELNCGILVHLLGGDVQQVSGNRYHPVNQGKLCSKAEGLLHSYQHVPRFTGPVMQARRYTETYHPISWTIAEMVIEQALRHTPSYETVILADSFPSHLGDFLTQMAVGMGGVKIYRLAKTAVTDGELHLREASQKLFGVSQIPFFDTKRADLVYSFGLEGSESWLSSISKLGGALQQELPGKSSRTNWVYFSSVEPDASVLPGAWIPVKAGCEARVAIVFSRLVCSVQNSDLPIKENPDLQAITEMISSPVTEVESLVRRFLLAKRKLAFPGLAALNEVDGYEAAEAVLKLNDASGNLGLQGGLFFLAPAPIIPKIQAACTTRRYMKFLVERMKQGRVKTIFVHGATQLAGWDIFEEFVKALSNVPWVISFNPSPDLLTRHADFIFPDHHILESRGYQKTTQGSDRVVVSGIQPVFRPGFDTRSTIDVFLAAIRRTGGSLASELPYENEVDFLRKSLLKVRNGHESDHLLERNDAVKDFYSHGGWWPENAVTIPPVRIG